MFPISLTKEEYEALVALARRASTTPDDERRLDAFLKIPEERNGVVRYSLWVQWQEAGADLPPGTVFPDVWPPEQRYFIQLVTRPIAKSDVEAVLENHARQPVEVMVTPDVGAEVGWTKLDDYFVT